MSTPITLGINLGYTHVKATDGKKDVTFKSLAGKRSTFLLPLSPLNGGYSFLSPAFFAGDMAEDYSHNPPRHQGYDWIQTPEYYQLFLAALSDFATLPETEAVIAVSLPPAYYLQGREKIKAMFEGSHVFHREGREPQTVTVTRCYVVPEAHAACYDEMMDDSGNILDLGMAKGDLAIIDFGGKTSIFDFLRGLKEVEHLSSTEVFGGWDIVATLKKIVKHKYQRELTDFQADTALREGQMWHDNGMMPLAAEIQEAKQAILPKAVSTIHRLWDNNLIRGLRAAFIVGGVTKYIGKDILPLFPSGRMSRRPVMANAYGLWKYLMYAEKEQSA